MFFFIPIIIGGLGIRVDDILILLCIPILILHAKYVVVEKYIIPIFIFSDDFYLLWVFSYGCTI